MTSQVEVKEEVKVSEIAERAHRIARQIGARKRAIDETWIEIGLDLVEICKLERVSSTEEVPRYELLNYETFESFLASPEINIGARMGYIIKGVAETFVLGHGFANDVLASVGPSKLEKLRQYIERPDIAHHIDRETIEELVLFAGENSRSSLVEHLSDHYRENYLEAVAAETGIPREELRGPRSTPWKSFSVDWELPPREIYRTTISELLNEILELRPEWSRSPLSRTVAKVLRMDPEEDS